jgi:predicted ester cyclase
MGIAPTNKHATVTGVDIDRYQDGKVVEAWASYDMFGMLQQLGVVPALAAGTKA